ncbi:MAG: Tryptophan synthase alpha chain, partial [Myxococcaceae bacterium]|nr:Tryptophan synthase alpha chain [Myxococcaceae bacterium]
MRRPASILLLTGFLVLSACSDPECRDGELKVGETCYPNTHRADAAAATAGDGGKAATAGPDASTTGRLDAAAAGDSGAVTPETPSVSGGGAPTLDAGSQPPAPCDGAVNACGGCDALSHTVGESCSNGGTGPCSAAGTYQCFEKTLKCNAPPPSPGTESCDGVDNDCNGKTDDVAASLLNACQKCGDVPPESCDGMDNDCDGMTDEDGVCGPPVTVVDIAA